MTEKDRSLDSASGPGWEMLARFVAGECSPEECRDMERLLEADPAHAEMLHALREAVRAPDVVAPTALEVEAALAKVRGQRGNTRTGPSTRRATVVSLDAYRSRWRDARLVAAAAVIVVAGGSLIWRMALSPRGDRMPAGTQTHYATAIGRLDSLQLPDGSRVLLGPGSKLDISPDFGTLSRDVTLKGEANFAVVHDPAHPFRVHTAWATFRDVGTEFVVHCDASGYAVGAVLQQDRGNGLQPVAFLSRKMVGAETRYPVHEQELLAIVTALTTWQHYLEGATHPVRVHLELRRDRAIPEHLDART